MCGRFALGLDHSQIQAMEGYPGVNIAEWINQDQFVPRYNIAPHSQAPVLRRRERVTIGGTTTTTTPAEDIAQEDILHTMKWGVVPHWSKHEDKSINTINARGENVVAGVGMWGRLRGKNRCIVLAQGYYEWMHKTPKEKLPYFTKRKDGRTMLLAGIYDCCYLEGEGDSKEQQPQQPLWTFAIVTTTASKEFEWLHERQPVILYSQEAIDTWLDTSSQTSPTSWSDELSKLIELNYDSAAPLECYQVPKEVGKVGNESKTYIEPVSQRKDGIQAMFSRQPKTPSKRKRQSTTPEKSSLTPDVEKTPSKKPKTRESPEVVEGLQTPTIKSTSKPTSKATPSKKPSKKATPSQGNKITRFFSKI